MTEPDPAAWSGKAEFTEDVTPVPDLGAVVAESAYREKRQPPHLDTTRRDIAYGVLGALGILYLIPIVGLVCHKVDVEGLKTAALILSGPQALAAAVVGFYFAQAPKSSS